MTQDAARRFCPECGAPLPGESLTCPSCGLAMGGSVQFAAIASRIEESLTKMKAGLGSGVFDSLKRHSHVVLPLLLCPLMAIALFSPYDADFRFLVIPILLVFLALSVFAIVRRLRRSPAETVDMGALSAKAGRSIDDARRLYGEDAEGKALLAEYEEELRLIRRGRLRDRANAFLGYLLVGFIAAFVVWLAPWRTQDELERIREEEARAQLAPVDGLELTIVPLHTALNGVLAEYVEIAPGPYVVRHSAHPGGAGMELVSPVVFAVGRKWDRPESLDSLGLALELTVLDRNGLAFYAASPFHATTREEELASALAAGSGKVEMRFSGSISAQTPARRMQVVLELLRGKTDAKSFVVSSRLVPKMK